MNLLESLKRLRDDIKSWVTNNLNALNAKIDEKTIPIDSELSATSTNPVQNKAIKKAIDNIPTFSGDYNDLTNAPDISEDGSGNMTITDESGNIIFKADADGIHTTAVSLNGEAAATEKYVDDAVANIPTPDVSGQINAHNASEEAHADIRQAIEDAKEELSESITSVSDKWEVADEAGNIIFRVDAEGTHTTNLTLDGEKAATLKDIEDAIGEIVIPEVPEVDYPDIEIKDDATIGAAEENFVNVYKNLTVDENNKHVLHEELVTIPKKEYVDEVADNLKEELSESIVAESDEWKVVDEAGNIIFSIDALGAHTTELTLNGESAATKQWVENKNYLTEHQDISGKSDVGHKHIIADITDFAGYATETYVDNKVADLVNSAPEALDTLGELAIALENHEDAYDALLETVGSKATHTDLENLKEELSESIVSETDEWKVVDSSGNIILSVDADGVHTTAITLNGQLIDEILTLPENGSFAHGEGSVAAGANSHAGGQNSIASNAASFVHGSGLKTNADNQFVVGQYNKEDPDALFIVGGGDSNENRKNLFTVKKDGSITGLNTSNALTKTASGEAIAITDVSPIEHEMNVKVRGKNLVNLSNAYVTSGGEMTIDGTAITLTRKATGNPPSIIFELGAYKDFVGKTLTISFVLDAMGSSGGTNGNASMAIHCGNTAKEAVESVNGISYSNGRVGETITKTFTVPVLDDKGRQLCIRHYMSNGKTEGDYITISNLQIEIGSTATAYTPYIEDISAVKVKKYGKNLIDIKNPTYKLNAIYGVDSEGVATLTRGDLATGISGTYVSRAYWELGNYDDFVGKTFVASLDVTEKSVAKSDIVYIVADFNTKTEKIVTTRAVSNANKHTFSFTVPENTGGWKSIGMRLYCESLGTGESTGEYIKFKDLQVEVGVTATECEEYKEPIEYPVSADGTVEGVTPIYPTTTLITDTAGAVIDCTYNRDINRVLDDTGFMYDHNPSGTGSFSMNRKVGSEIGEYSHTEGYSSAAIGKASHAGGEATQAKGIGSFAHGQRVTADADYQATFGTHNEVNTNAAFIVGNGSSSAKSNAFEVQKDGNAFVKGDLYIGGTGSTQASAKQVATKDSISAMEQRINNLEDITSSTGGVFFEDADVAYVKTIPENVAPYASLNKVGGLGTPCKNVVNLFPATYNISNGTMSDYDISGQYTFNADADGVITVTDTTPHYEFESEPWASAEFLGMATVELAAGTYTINLESLDEWAPPFALHTDMKGQSYTIGGYWGSYDGYGETPLTFTLEEDTTLTFDFGYSCGGSTYFPSGDGSAYRYRIMLNKGTSAEAWVAPSTGGPTDPYIEQPKVTSIDIIGKNVLDYGEPRIIQDGNANTEGEIYFEIRDNGTLYIRDMRIPVPMGPDSIYGTSITATIPLDADTIYPAGTYSMGASVEADGLLYLTARAKSLDGTQSIMIQGSNNIISTPFAIQLLELTYEPSYDSYSMPSVEIPLVLVRGAVSPVGVIPSKRSHIVIPETLLSREDYGIGVYDTRSGTLYTNSIDFDNKKYLKNCLTYDQYAQSLFFDLHESKINTTIASNTIQCSDPNIAVDIYENSDADPNRRLVEIYAYSANPDNPIDNMEAYLSNAMEAGTPVKVFFGTNLTEEVDISAELAGIDNYIPVEAGGLIYFNNDRQEAVPSTIEYQSMMKKGEIEEL